MTWDYYNDKIEKAAVDGMSDEVEKALVELDAQLNKASVLLQGLRYAPENIARLRIISKEYPNFIPQLEKAVDFITQAIDDRLFEIVPSTQPDPNE
jgi:hypothetical protein